MMGTGQGYIRTGYFLICLLVLAFFSSCSDSSSQDLFLARLDRVDTLSTSGKNDAALRELVRLRKKASSAGQWLSLVKRERLLGSNDQAIDTLRIALTHLPANDTLAAVMTDTLVLQGLHEQAVDYAKPLLSSPYAAVAAMAGMERLVKDGRAVDLDPAFFSAAYRISANPGFLKLAAVLHAGRGEYVQGSSLLLALQDNPYRYLTALLAYDAGFYEKHRSLYPAVLDTDSCTAEELLLLADSHFRLGLLSESRALWLQLLEEYPGYSPVPYFNRARTSGPGDGETALLSLSLQQFPVYYPAIALYSHQARTAPKPSSEDVVSHALRSAGFVSTVMAERQSIERPDVTKAALFVSRALSDPVGNQDPRFAIEYIRLAPFLESNTERTDALVWKLLEQYPLHDLAYDYALWYFLSSGAYDTAFSLNKSRPAGPAPLYSALEAAMLGMPDRSVEYFMEMANDDTLAWLGLANASLVHFRQGNKQAALEELIIAASMAPDRKTESSIQYRIAVILESMRSYDRSESVLGYALDLDPDNHLARAMLGKIRAGK